MGSSAPPPAPEPPDYSEVMRESNEWAPIMSGIEQAKRLGETFTYNVPGSGEEKVADFTGRGDIDVARKMQEFAKESTPSNVEAVLDIYKRYGPEYVKSSREQLEAADPYGFGAREMLGEEVTESVDVDLPIAPEMELAGEVPTYERIEEGDIPVVAADDTTVGGRRYMEEELIDRLESGRTARRVGDLARQAALGRQAATGNIFGGGAAVEEARAVQAAEEAQRAQDFGNYLAYLQSGQTATDLQSRIAQQNLANRMMGIEQRTGALDREEAAKANRLAQRNQAIQQSYQNVMGRTLQQAGLQQQRLANMQAFAFGQPLVNQLGALGGMQQQAAPYTPTQVGAVGQPIGNQLAQAQNFALGRYGTQADVYGTQAQLSMQPSGLAGFGKLLGTTIGAAGQAKGFGNLFS